MRIHSDDFGYTEVIVFGLAFIGFLGLAASWNFDSFVLNFLVLVFAALCLLIFHATHVGKKAYIRVDAASGCVLSHRVNLLGKEIIETYKLSEFHGVVSFLNATSPSPDTWAGTQYNCVELIAKQKGKGLVVARFNPNRLDKKFLTSPTYGESDKAVGLRQFFVEQCAMTDLGFAGRRSFREPLKPQASASHIE